MFLEISQNSQEITCARASFLISCTALMYGTNTKRHFILQVFFKFLNVFFLLHISKLNLIINPERRECFIQSVQLTYFCQVLIEETLNKDSQINVSEETKIVILHQIQHWCFMFPWFQSWDLKHDYMLIQVLSEL